MSAGGKEAALGLRCRSIRRDKLLPLTRARDARVSASTIRRFGCFGSCMVSGRSSHNATTRRAIGKGIARISEAYGLKISGPFRTKIIRGKTWRDLSPAETSLLLACDACEDL